MSQLPEPKPPIAEPVPVEGELVAPPPAKQVDPVIEIQQLRDQRQRWKNRFVAVCVAFVFLFIVSVLQFIGTFITCQVLFSARRESERSQQQTHDLLEKLADARNSMNQASQRLADSRQTVGEVETIKATLQRLDAQASRLMNSADVEAQRMIELADAKAMNEMAERRLRDVQTVIEDRLREADGLLEQMRGLKEQQRSQVLPFVDPNYKHPRACPVDQWPGVRGMTTAREPTAVQLEEEEHEFALLPGPAIEGTATLGENFTKDVLAIFQAKCSKCHIESRKGKLSLKSLADVLKGGESGPAVVRGSLKDSVLWQAISDCSMPPKGEPRLTEAEVAIIKHWITLKK